MRVTMRKQPSNFIENSSKTEVGPSSLDLPRLIKNTIDYLRSIVLQWIKYNSDSSKLGEGEQEAFTGEEDDSENGDCENDEGEATEEELDRIEGEKYDVERKCSNKIVRGVSKPDVQLPLQQRGLKMEKEYKLVSESMKSTSYFPSHGVQCNSGIHDRMDHTTSDTDDNNDVTSVPADEADLHQGNDFGDNDPSTNDVLETNDGYDTDDNKESVTFDKTLSVRSDEIVLDAVYIGYVDYIGDSYLQSAPPLTSKLYYESMDSEDSDSDDENNEKRFKKFYKF